MRTRPLTLALFVLGACTVGGGGGNNDDGDDDPPRDAPEELPAVEEVIPCLGEDATVTAEGAATIAYTPEETVITVNQVVKFVVDAEHDVTPDIGGEPALVVNPGQTKCFRFLETGAFEFFCRSHSFAGTVTVN
jgi:plastocyanin